MSGTHRVTLEYYSLADLRRVADDEPTLALSDEVQAEIAKGAAFVREKAKEDRYIYGTNTGFGALCETRVENEEMEALQYRHVLSHAVGVGPIVSQRLSRLCLFIKLLTFRTGHTGISMNTVGRMIDMWNAGAIPTIPKKGSVGASGDLAPLAHMALPLLGLGSCYFRGEVTKSADVLRELGMTPLILGPKEGLALTNGIQYINANAANLLFDIRDYARCADVLHSLSAQAFSTSETYFQERYHKTSFHPERQTVAANLRTLMEGTNKHELPTANKSKQDPYSFRCTPQVHGAIRQTIDHATQVIEQECNSVSDNPLFFPDDDEILFGGALHGESSALVLDYLAIAMTELSNISERRTYQLLSGQRGLPDFLVKNPGLNSGLMIAQYTSAALLNENKVLAHPASADTVPTCQLQEDHVSMGATSAYKLETIVDNARHIFAIELLHAMQAIDFMVPQGLVLSKTTREIHAAFREQVTHMEEDRLVGDDIQAALAFLDEHQRHWAAGLGLS